MSRRALVVTAVAAASAVVVVLVAVAVVLVVRASHEEPGTDAHLELPEPSSTPAGGASMAIGRIFSWNPAAEAGPWDALHAASDQVTGTLARAAGERPAQEPLPRQWAQWAASGDRVVAATEVPEQTEPGDATRVPVRLVLRQVVRHSDGTTTPLEEMTVVVDMVLEGQTWKAAEYRFV